MNMYSNTNIADSIKMNRQWSIFIIVIFLLSMGLHANASDSALSDSDSEINNFRVSSKQDIRQRSETEQLEIYNKMLAENPESSTAYLERGRLYQERGRRSSRSWSELNHRIKINPQDFNSVRLRGEAQKEIKKNYALAISNFGRAIQYGPDNWQTHFTRGMALLEKYRVNIMRSNLGVAIDDFEEAIRLDPSHRESYYYRGLCYLLNDKPEEAYKDFERLLIENPNDANLQFQMGECCEKLRNKAGAKASYEACARLAEESDPRLAAEAMRRVRKLK